MYKPRRWEFRGQHTSIYSPQQFWLGWCIKFGNTSSDVGDTSFWSSGQVFIYFGPLNFCSLGYFLFPAFFKIGFSAYRLDAVDERKRRRPFTEKRTIEIDWNCIIESMGPINWGEGRHKIVVVVVVVVETNSNKQDGGKIIINDRDRKNNMQ